LINDKDICCHRFGAGPPKLKILKNKNIEISLIDICSNYQLISTKLSEISLLSGEYIVGRKMYKYITPSCGNPTPNNLN